MDALRWIQFAARWALVLIEAAGLLWTAALLLALLAWFAWGACQLVRRARAKLSKPPPLSIDAASNAGPQAVRHANRDPVTEMERTPR